MKSKTEIAEQKVSNSAIVRAWFEKYDWLGDHFDKSEIEKVIPATFNIDILRVSSGHIGYGTDYWNSETLRNKIIFFDQCGTWLGQVGKKVQPVAKRRFFGFVSWGVENRTILFEENVELALSRFRGYSPMIRFIIGQKDKTLFITSILDGLNIMQAIDKEMALAREIVEKTLSEKKN